MYLMTASLHTERRSKLVLVEAHSLASAWVAGGQLVGPHVVGEHPGGYRIAGVVPLAGAMDDYHQSPAAARHRSRLESDFGAVLDISVEDHDGPPVHAPSLQVASELFLGGEEQVRRVGSAT